MGKSKLQEIKERWQHLEDRKSRAAKRTSEENLWYFALCGFKADFDDIGEEGVFLIKRVEEPPNEMELASALRQSNLFSAIGRYSLKCNYELGVIKDDVISSPKDFSLAWWIISGIRIKTLANFLVTATADRSWDTIAAAPKNSVSAHLVEDFPMAYNWSREVVVLREDVEWVSKNLNTIVELLKVPKFRVAVESLTTHNQMTNLRMVIASLWAGIEALTEISTELSYRISSYVASFLEPAGPRRLELFYKLKKHYVIRSKAVHGRNISDEEIKNSILDTMKILSDVLCKIIEEQHVPNKKDFEKKLLCC